MKFDMLVKKIKNMQSRLHLFWLQTDSGNDFPEKWVFGWFGKLGETENNFR